MADYHNINEPRRFDGDWDGMLEREKLKTELSVANKRIDALVNDLDAIFTRIQRGDTVTLYYRKGEAIEVGAVSPRTETEA